MSTTRDTWTCCQCKSPNNKTLCPVQCSQCPHKKCDDCTSGAPKGLLLSHGHYSLPKTVDMGVKEVIGVGEDENVEVAADVFMHGDEGLVHVMKRRGS